jgi:hypothetical protein
MASGTKLNDLPVDHPVVDPATGKLTGPWQQYLTRTHRVAEVGMLTVTTATRPTRDLYLGMTVLDKTLGKNITLTSVRPPVWVDGAGTPV